MRKFIEILVFAVSKIIFEFLFNKILKSKILYAGQENVTENPTLFVANHYTRIETALLPYIHWLVTGRRLQVLAHQIFFVGWFGEWLRICGAFPMDDPKRNNRIVGDLMTGRYNWAIFPEGNMVKNRSVFERGKFVLDCPGKKGPPHTGAAVLALKAEIFKRSYLNAVDSGDRVSMQYYETTYDFSGPDEICRKSIVISPLSISYYPLRTGDNFLLYIVSKLFGKASGRFEEELRVEGNFLFKDTDIDHHFGPAIHLDDFLSHLMPIKRGLHKFFRDEDINNLILEWQRTKLTQRCMAEIYQRIYINVDELASYCIRALPAGLEEVEEEKLRLAIYTSALEIRELNDTFVHSSLRGNLLPIINGEGYQPLEEFFMILQQDNLLTFSEGLIQINRAIIDAKSDFHRVRMTNKIEVLANGLEPLESVTRLIRKNMGKSLKQLRRDICSYLLEQDKSEYIIAREESEDLIYPEEELADHESIFLEGSDKEHSTGVLLGHDLLATPNQMKLFAEQLHRAGFTVFCPRLTGHGTSERDLINSSWEDWQNTYNRAFTLLKHSCAKVIVGGFSAGALLALNRASRKGVFGAFVLNPAVSLKDYDFYLIPAAYHAAKFMRRVGRPLHRLEWRELEHNLDDVRASRISLTTMYEWRKLRQVCKRSMPKITVPILVIRAADDPVLSTYSSDRITNNVQSEYKQQVELEFYRRSLFSESQGRKLMSTVIDYLHDLNKGVDFLNKQKEELPLPDSAN